ncbi:hypothetical protein DRN75_00560 [Nanoarchaeota archaeon]|nr:MAG: hypothetical protein DRN75_00560 [Nanoarchaeota archaeon]
MPTNVTAEYRAAEKKYQEASTTEEKIKYLREMLATVPKHKGTEKLQAQIKEKIAKLRRRLVKEKKLARRGAVFSVKKQGCAQVCLFSLPNTGKSYFLNKYCGKSIPSTDKPFETQRPEVGMLDYSGAKVQVVELPSVFKGYAEKYPNYLSIVRTCDLVVIFGDSSVPLDELNEISIKKIVSTPDKAVQEIWKALGLIKVFTKEPGGEVAREALGLRRGATVKDVAENVHKDFLKRFKYAKVWGKSVKFEGQVVGLNHVLEDGDVVELHADK